MQSVVIKKLNESHGYISQCDKDTINDLYEYLSFYVNGYKYMPSYKNGMFDGKVHLLDRRTHMFPLGLIYYISDFLKVKNIPYLVEDDVRNSFVQSVSKADFQDFVQSIKMFSKGERIIPRDDQIYAVYEAITKKRCVNICPTSFGKSLSITLECIWFIKQSMKCLIVVPRKNLVEQFANDIADYATNERGEKEPWFPNIQKIYTGKSKVLSEDTDICISTWQSLSSLEDDFVNNFDLIVLDECHTGAAKVVQKVVLNATDVSYRTGWTGTLSNETLNELLVTGLFGPAKEITTTKELMDKKIVAQLSIVLVRLIYEENECRSMCNLEYAAQSARIEDDQRRDKVLMNIVRYQNKTGLILFKHKIYAKRLHETAQKTFPDRNVYLFYADHYQINDKIYKNLEDIKPMIENDPSGIIIANYQLVGTGMSIKNLNWMMFAVPFKSFISVIQGIGRILRVSKVKTKAMLIDIVDDFSYRSKPRKIGSKGAIHTNYAVRHFSERFDIYNRNKFDYKILNIHVKSESEETTRDVLDI